MGRKKRKKRSKGEGQRPPETKGEEGLDQPSGQPPRAAVGDWLDRLLERRERLVVLGVALVALALRLWHLVEIEVNDPFFYLPSVDPKVFHDWAVAIADGDLVGEGVYFLSPLYPYFLALIYALVGPGLIAGKLVQLVLGAVSCVLVYAIGKRVFSPRVGLLAELIAALYLMAIFYEGVLLVTGLQTPLNLLMVWLLLRAQGSPRPLPWGLAGLVLGLSALARPNVLLLGGFAVLWIVIRFRRELSWARLALPVGVFCVGVGLAVLPVTVRNYVVGDDLVLVSAQGGPNFYIGNGPDSRGTFNVPRLFSATRGDDPNQQREIYGAYAEQQLGRELKPSEVSDFWYDETWEHIASDRGAWLGLLARKLGLFVNKYEVGNSRDFYSSRDFSVVLGLPLITFGMVAPLALLGMGLAVRRWRRAYFLYAMIAVYTATSLIFFVLAHYRMPCTPYFMLFAAFALAWLIDKLRARRLAQLGLAAVALVAAVAVVQLDLADGERSRFMVHYNLGNKFRAMGKGEEAIEQYRRSIEYNPQYISSHNNLALQYQLLGRYEEATAEWRTVMGMARARGDMMYVQRANQYIEMMRRGVELQPPPGPGQGDKR